MTRLLGGAGRLLGTHAHEVMSITAQLLASFDDQAGGPGAPVGLSALLAHLMVLRVIGNLAGTAILSPRRDPSAYSFCPCGSRGGCLCRWQCSRNGLWLKACPMEESAAGRWVDMQRDTLTSRRTGVIRNIQSEVGPHWDLRRAKDFYKRRVN